MKKNKLTEVEIQKAKAAEMICIGIVANNMKYANQGLVCSAGRDLFFFIKKMTYRQFRNIKKLSAID